MKRKEFKLFIDVLSILKDYTVDVVVKNGKIFQMSDSRTCILDVDVSSLFSEEDYSEFITFVGLNNKLDLFKILYNMINDDDDEIRFALVDNEYLRLFPIGKSFYIDFRVSNTEYIKTVLDVTNDLKQMTTELSDYLITTKTFSKEEYKAIKKLQDKIGASGLDFYYYNDKTLMFLNGSVNGMNANLGRWEVKNPSVFNESNVLYDIQVLTDFVFPNLDSGITVQIFANVKHQSPNKQAIVSSSGTISNDIPFSIYSVYLIKKVSDDYMVESIKKHMSAIKE